MAPRDETATSTSHPLSDDGSLTPTRRDKDLDARSPELKESDDKKPSNEQVLNVAFYSFVGFMAVQAVFALIAHSQSMLADSEAMSVDAVTYLFNLCAERIKNRPPTEAELQLTAEERQCRRELRRLYLEMIPPTISVMALIVITIYTLDEACRTLFGPDGSDDDDDVSVPIMLFFSGLNLLLDVVNVTCFARANMNFGLSVVQQEHTLIRDKMMDVESTDACEQKQLLPHKSSEVTYGSSENTNGLDADGSGGSHVLVNLNMCSAWTHVCADTLRSTAVLLAAAIATLIPSIDGAVADSSAAIVVSVIILISLLPLVQGLVLTALRIRTVRRSRCLAIA